MKSLSNLFKPTKGKLVVLGILVVAGGTLITLEKTHVTNFYTRHPKTTDQTKTTSDAKTAQSNYTSGNQRDAGNDQAENRSTGGITDNKGAVDASIDTSNPIVSKTGEISVYTPKENTQVNSGYKVNGASTLPVVSYRLIDTITGVIASGDLSVVNGKFSGSLSFDTNATSGRLDLFATKADGTEYSNVEIPLGFKL